MSGLRGRIDTAGEDDRKGETIKTFCYRPQRRQAKGIRYSTGQMVSYIDHCTDQMIVLFRGTFTRSFQVFVVYVEFTILVVNGGHMLRIPEGMGQEIHDKRKEGPE